MSIEHWWSKLKPSTRTWLIENNGDEVPADVVAEITAAGGPGPSDAWWIPPTGPSGPCFPDEAVDWIEAVGNGEASVRT
ncbi:hypothetical protein ABH924_004405 [Arthrobacter sp. GAS37]|uniref:hypothetical protein n=1 Tax=Arthrobacter sp. GAS37 TaxID=3156261 RepID=UPI00383757EB